MGILKDFFNQKNNKNNDTFDISILTTEQKLNLLKDNPLDDKTLDKLIQDLDIDFNKFNKQFKFNWNNPKVNIFSDKQNQLRMMTGQFVTNDEIIDVENCMGYNYYAKYSNASLQPTGFEGKMIRDELIKQNKNGSEITIPADLFGAKIVSLRYAFARIPELKYCPKIEGKGILFDNAFEYSGLTKIPDISKIEPTIYNFKPDNLYMITLNIYASLLECNNITPQIKFDYILAHADDLQYNKDWNYMNSHVQHNCFNKNDDKRDVNQILVQYIASLYFNIDTNYISVDKADAIQEELNIINEKTPLNDKLKYYLSTFESAKPYQKDLLHHLEKEIGIKDIYLKYLQSLSLKDVTIQQSIPLIGTKNKIYTLYKINTSDNFTFVYNPLEKEILSFKDRNIEFQDIDPSQIKETFNSILEDCSKTFADNILDNDNVSLPSETASSPELTNIDIDESR
jgi:hypothetical protein